MGISICAGHNPVSNIVMQVDAENVDSVMIARHSSPSQRVLGVFRTVIIDRTNLVLYLSRKCEYFLFAMQR
jgi:hypothetical protein